MHPGHKLLLTQAALLASNRLLIGVTSDCLLKKKAYAAYLEEFDLR
jgi:phosphopantetheine adenylyltransferase